MKIVFIDAVEFYAATGFEAPKAFRILQDRMR